MRSEPRVEHDAAKLMISVVVPMHNRQHAKGRQSPLPSYVLSRKPASPSSHLRNRPVRAKTSGGGPNLDAKGRDRLVAKIRSVAFALLSVLASCLFAHAATPTFTVTGGKIIAPNGQPFVPRGVDVVDCSSPTCSIQVLKAADITTAFPGTSMVKIQVESGYNAPSYYTSFVNSLTSIGIVVEIGNYNNGYSATYACWAALTGSALTTEVSWYTALATAFINNPYVWFSTTNEPCDGATSGSSNAEQVAIYNAIRGTGSNAIIGIDPIGGWTTGLYPAPNGYLDAASFTSRTNIHWDVHYYNWAGGFFQSNCGLSGSGFSTSLSANEASLAAMIACAQSFATSANGRIPVIIGEYGNATRGALPADAGWVEAVQAVINAAGNGFGSTADVYYYPIAQGGSGATGDQLFTNGLKYSPPTLANPGLSDYGLQVAAGIAAGGRGSPTTITTLDPNNRVGSGTARPAR
jgi:hypothetical protein